MWVYVKFLEDDVCEIVEASNIKRFDKDDIKYNQKYSVKWKDGDYYKAQIIYAKDSLKDLTEVIETRRVRMVRKQLLKSGDESSSEEGTAGTSRDKIAIKKSLDLKKAAMENARKNNEIKILNKHSSEKAQLEHTSTSKQTIYQDFQKTIDHLKKENDMLKKENGMLKKEKESFKTKTEHFEDLNISLQKEVIDLLKDFKNKLTPDIAIHKPGDIKVGQIVDDEVHIGQDIFLKKSTYNSCLVSARSGAQFVKNIAVAIFGIDVLKNSSVTGKTSNRIKKPDARPPLDPNKLQAIRDIYKHYLLQKGQDEVSLDYDLSKIGVHISSKISDLNRMTRSKPTILKQRQINIDSQEINLLEERNSDENNVDEMNIDFEEKSSDAEKNSDEKNSDEEKGLDEKNSDEEKDLNQKIPEEEKYLENEIIDAYKGHNFVEDNILKESDLHSDGDSSCEENME
ncbi:unnamed protein product [Phaedon cochleariae]|uniref:BEN domain-containing protein n=1 Tax=Phaedon cochleariae TaxID=80249 RepID=A0A9P0GVX9_PHACE|nr:unnamed protein product [Phaedon cochleariae]